VQLTPNLVIRGHVVEKRGPPRALRIEAEKMQRAAAIGKASGLFRVPELVGLDLEEGVLRMEYVRGLRGIRRVRLPTDRYLRAIEQAGEALCRIHRDLALPSEFRLSLPDELDHVGTGVCLHGDYSGENVCVVEREGKIQLVVIDWQTTPRIGIVATYGTRYFDIGWFIGNLFRKPVYKYLAGPAVEKAALSFLRGYMRNAPGRDHFCGLGEYLERLCDYRLENHEKGLFFLKRMLLSPGLGAWKTFARTLDARTLENA